MGVDNLVLIESNKKSIVTHLILEKTKCCSLRWNRLATNLFEAAFDESEAVSWTARLEKIVGRSGNRSLLQIYRNDQLCLQLSNASYPEIEEIHLVIEELVEPDFKIQESLDVLNLMRNCTEWKTYNEAFVGGVVGGGLSITGGDDVIDSIGGSTLAGEAVVA